MLVIAASDGAREPVRAMTLATDQQIPLSFLQSILLDLVRAGLLHSFRGTRGGYRLSRPSETISIGEILRAVAGELTSIRGVPAAQTTYRGAATGLHPFWMTLTTGMVQVLDTTSLADLRVS